MTSALLCLSFLFAAAEPPADKERIETIHKEILELKAQIADKECEIVRLSPVTKVVSKIFLKNAAPGIAGPFGTTFTAADGSSDSTVAAVEIVKIVDSTTMVVAVLGKQKPRLGRIEFEACEPLIYVSNCNTDKILPGVRWTSPEYRVLGGKIIDGKVYIHVEPYTPKKK